VTVVVNDVVILRLPVHTRGRACMLVIDPSDTAVT